MFSSENARFVFLFGFVWLCLALFGFVWLCLALFGFLRCCDRYRCGLFENSAFISPIVFLVYKTICLARLYATCSRPSCRLVKGVISCIRTIRYRREKSIGSLVLPHVTCSRLSAPLCKGRNLLYLRIRYWNEHRGPCSAACDMCPSVVPSCKGCNLLYSRIRYPEKSIGALFRCMGLFIHLRLMIRRG